MITAGIREVKARLSSYIDKVGRGAHVVITEHGRELALLIPISKERRAIGALIESGKAQWSGGKPQGLKGIKIRGNPLSETILEERR